MSSYYQNGNAPEDRDRKLSGLSKKTPGEQPDGGGTPDKAGKTGKAGKAGKMQARPTLSRGSRRTWLVILVDVLLLALIAGLVVGGIFGYRAVRDIYAPVWEVRDVVFGVKLENIPPEMLEYGSGGKYVIMNKPIWSSEATDADMLGSITDVHTVTVSTEDSYTVTLYLKVEAKAYYREGKGYRMGETMLLAGTTGTYRMEGLVAEGMIIFMHEADDPLAQTSWTDRFEQNGTSGK